MYHLSIESKNIVKVSNALVEDFRGRETIYFSVWPDGGGLKQANPFSHHPHQDDNALLEEGEGKTGDDDDINNLLLYVG